MSEETEAEHAGDVGQRPDVEPWGWMGDWLDRWPPVFGRRVPELFDRGFGAMGGMRVEQYVDGDESVVRAELPGVDPEKDIEISVIGDKLTISATREQREKSETDDGFRTEFHYGSFRRSMTLPAGTDPDDVKASYEDGILEIRMPIVGEREESRKIPISRS